MGVSLNPSRTMAVVCIELQPAETLLGLLCH